jgi:hypothetical protein
MNSADVASQLRRMSPQRWFLAFAAVVSGMLVPIVTGIAGSGQSPIVLAVVVGLAGASVTRPDSHVALMVPLIAVWHWTASADASTSAWALVVALCLFVFHTLVALMSTTPPRATIDAGSVFRWLRRSVVVASATGTMWLLVVGVDQLDLAGSAIVTAIGFVAATTLLVAMIAPRRTQPAPAENVAQRSSSSHSAIHRSR